MSLLRYPGLTLADGESLLGQPLGCTPNGLPLQVIGVSTAAVDGITILELEEWDPPLPGETDPWYGPAAQYALYVWRGQSQPPTAGHDPDKERPTPP